MKIRSMPFQEVALLKYLEAAESWAHHQIQKRLFKQYKHSKILCHPQKRELADINKVRSHHHTK